MGSVLQFAAFFSICWLIRGVVAHPNQDDGKQLNNKHSNQNGNGDFYFEEQKTNNDNVKSGRSISQSAWSKEDKEQIQRVEKKAEAQLNDEFNFKSTLSYLLNMLHELKQDIFGIKELTSLKNTMGETNSKDKVKQKGESDDSPKSDTSTINIEFEKENRKPKSNYIIDYYQKNGIKFVDDDLETSGDESDDSSHKPNEVGSMHEDSKNKDGPCISECVEVKRKPDRYSSGAGEIASNPMSQTKVPKESDMGFDDIKGSEKNYDFKESTEKTSKMKQSKSKAFLTGRCMKKKNDNSNNLNKKNEPIEKPLKSAEIVTKKSSQNENFNKAKSERFNQNEIGDNLSKVTLPSPDSEISEKNSQNQGGSDFDSKSGILKLSTTLTSQDSVYSDNVDTKLDVSGMSSDKTTSKKEQEQITSLKQEEQDQTPNKAESLQNKDRKNEKTTISLPLKEAGSETPNQEPSSAAEIQDSPEESKSRKLNGNSHTNEPYSENESNSKTDRQQTSHIFDNSNIISPNTPGNFMNTDNLNGKRGPEKNEKSDATRQGKNYSETQRDNQTGQKQTKQFKENSEPGKSLKNIKFQDSNPEKNNKEEDGNLASMATKDLPFPQDSKAENQNIEESDKSQEAKKNKESLNEKDEVNSKRGPNKNEESNASQQGKIHSETQRDNETGQKQTQQLNDKSELGKSLKNKKLKDWNPENNNKEKDGNLASKTTNSLTSSQDSNDENQNIEKSDKQQEAQENNESLNEEDEMTEISPDQEDEDDEDEDFDVSDEYSDIETDGDFDQNQEGEFILNDENEGNDYKYPSNTATVFRSESQISQLQAEKSQEQYNTFLEYFYKHSNNSLIHSLKNQSNNFSQ